MRVRNALLLLVSLSLALVPVAAKKKEAEESARLSADNLSGLKLRGIGPALMSGRIADIAIRPDD